MVTTNPTGALAIIPARGGSKGIPGKNIKPLCGKPLIAWTIEAARAASRVGRVVVTTDDPAIAATAEAYGARVVGRPADLATDEASSESALLHALNALEAAGETLPATMAFLQCTAPLMTAADIDGTLALLDEGYDSAVTMTPFHYFLWRDGPDGGAHGVNHEATRRLRRQDRTPEYQEVGAVYAMQTAGFRRHGFRFFGRIGRHLVPASRSLELDIPDDWSLAELLMRQTGRVGQPAVSPERLRRVRAVVTDFDGVLTDNRVRVDQDGREAVVCHRGDGWGIDLLKAAGIAVACISTETNPVVSARCRKLNIPVWQGERDKLSALRAFLSATGLDAGACLYVGNDTNDAGCLAHAGIAVVPADAAPEVVPLADWRTSAAGGDGVLREVARALIAVREDAA